METNPFQISLSTENLLSVSNLSAISDPFNEGSFLSVEALTDGLNFNLADGTVPLVTGPDEPFVLIKGHNPGTWFFAPRWGRLARRPDGKPAFLITKKVKNNPDGSQTTLGGILSFMVELVVELPDTSAPERWTNLIKTLAKIEPPTGGFSFQSLRLTDGKMNVYGLSGYVAPSSQPITNVDVGASSSIGFAIELNAEGADYIYGLVSGGRDIVPQVAIIFNFKYDTYVPTCMVKAKGSKLKTYNYFSENIKARASYYGLVSGSAERSVTRAALKEAEGLDVEIVGTPPQGVDLAKLLDSIFDQFVKLEVGNWINPDPTPVKASSLGGYFGGVSYAMKKVDLSAEAKFDQVLSFSSIKQEVFQVSFNFEQQLADFDKSEHAFIVEDDVKLPYLVTFSQSSLVSSYNIAATYSTGDGGIRTIDFGKIDASKPEDRQGIIQFPRGNRPPSAQMTVIVDFFPPNVGYKLNQIQSVSDTGASFYFQPDVFCQRTSVWLAFAVLSEDPRDRAIFKWTYEPPNDAGAMRVPLSKATLIVPPTSGSNFDIPSISINFPFHPNDWKGSADSSPKIKYEMKGMAGKWKNNQPIKGEISLFETSIEILEWEAATFSIRSVGEELVVPQLLLNRYSNSIIF
jgi:hypothetical protein